MADGVPSRDLLLTQKDCMVFDGKIVPARMFVNGISVFLDRPLSEYVYYHIEFEMHEAIWAEDALTESYFDTGNRYRFDNNSVVAVYPLRKLEGGSETLPLDTSRIFVEPIYNAILARIRTIAPVHQNLVNDPDLRLMTKTGAVIRAHRVKGNHYILSSGRHRDSSTDVAYQSPVGCYQAVRG